MEEAVGYVNDRDKALALYVFTESSKTFQGILNKTSSGAIVRNETILQCAGKMSSEYYFTNNLKNYFNLKSKHAWDTDRYVYREGSKQTSGKLVDD